jgi:NitT/TauT family transport system permease protein
LALTEAGLSLEAPADLREATTVASRRRRRRRPPVFWRVRDDIPWRLEVALIIASLLLPLVVWQLLFFSKTVDPLFLPSPAATAKAAYNMITDGQLLDDTFASSRRVAFGFSISLLIAIPLGLGMGTFRSIRALFEPFIGFVRYAPATAFVPLLVIWLGLGEQPKIALVVLGTVFFNTLMTANVVWQVPSELIKVTHTLGAGSWSVFRKVIFPHSVPGMIDVARVNLAAAWNLIVVTEMFNAEFGLGRLIVRSQKFLHIDEIFAAIIVIGLIGVTTDVTLRMLRNRVAPWSQE